MPIKILNLKCDSLFFTLTGAEKDVLKMRFSELQLHMQNSKGL